MVTCYYRNVDTNQPLKTETWEFLIFYLILARKHLFEYLYVAYTKFENWKQTPICSFPTQSKK